MSIRAVKYNSPGTCKLPILGYGTEITVDPATLFELSGNSGPKYIDINAGTIIQNRSTLATYS